jgi:folate-dependent phosphoribosylglycinamide formyltransferase PurN
LSDRRVVLLAQPGDATNIVYNALRGAFNIAGVVMERAPPKRSILRRRLEKLGIKKVIGQVAFKATVVPLLQRSSRARIADICTAHGLNRESIPASAVRQVESVNADAARAHLRELQASVVVVNGTRIISKETLSATSAPFVNTHAGITPLYRGVHGGYWALAQNDAPNCGVTVHLVDTGIDTGGILAQATIEPMPHDNFVTYPYLQYAAALPLLLAAVGQLLAGEPATQPAPVGGSRLWSHPTLGEYLRTRLAGTQ